MTAQVEAAVTCSKQFGGYVCRQPSDGDGDGQSHDTYSHMRFVEIGMTPDNAAIESQHLQVSETVVPTPAAIISCSKPVPWREVAQAIAHSAGVVAWRFCVVSLT